jgi:hypothetical protein
MAGTDGDNSTPRPISPISPTEALRLVLSSKPNRSIHQAAKDLTEWTHGNDCRLWCNGNLLHPKYIATSLKIVAETEVDGRPRADVVSSVREGWERDPSAYTFELDADEVRRALLPPPRVVTEQPASEPVPSLREETGRQEPQPEEDRRLTLLPEEPQFEAPKKRRPEEAMQWLAEKMGNDPPKSGDRTDWARRYYRQMENDFGEDIPWSLETLRRRMNDV